MLGGSLNTGAPPKDLGSILKAASGITGVGFELDLSMDWDIPPFFNIGWSSSLKDLSSADAWLKSNAIAFSLHLP